jgi:hypothetical protein
MYRDSAQLSRSVSDPLSEQLGNVAGEAIGRWLEERGKLNQPIRSLEKHELTGMAWSAISAYLDKRAELERPEASRPPPPSGPFGI